MKKKIIAILISVLLILVSFTFGGCFKSCLEPPTPTKNDVIKNIKRLWDVSLPENIALINYSLSAGMRDYAHLYVFEYKDSEEVFTKQLVSDKNEEIEKFFIELCEKRKGEFNKDYILPIMSEEYFWLHDEQIENELVIRELYILYFPLENQILVYNYKL